VRPNDDTAAWLRFIDALGLDSESAWYLALRRLAWRSNTRDETASDTRDETPSGF
jgi:hypothetical protein